MYFSEFLFVSGNVWKLVYGRPVNIRQGPSLSAGTILWTSCWTHARSLFRQNQPENKYSHSIRWWKWKSGLIRLLCWDCIHNHRDGWLHHNRGWTVITTQGVPIMRPVLSQAQLGRKKVQEQVRSQDKSTLTTILSSLRGWASTLKPGRLNVVEQQVTLCLDFFVCNRCRRLVSSWDRVKLGPLPSQPSTRASAVNIFSAVFLCSTFPFEFHKT